MPVLLAALAAASASADVPKALAVLEVESATMPGHVGASAPVRFVLLETGQIYVGGTSEIAVGQLTSSEQKALEKRLGDLRKLPGIGGAVAFGSGKERVAPDRAQGAAARHGGDGRVRGRARCR